MLYKLSNFQKKYICFDLWKTKKISNIPKYESRDKPLLMFKIIPIFFK